MKNTLLLLAIFTLISCSSGRLSKTDAVSEQETVVVGRFTILNNGKDVTKNSRIYFDENDKGILTYKLPADGLVIMKIPKGNHFVKLIYTPQGSVNLPDGYAIIAVPESGKVYYIGDIEIDGSGMLQKKFKGIVYDVAAKDLKEKKIPIRVFDRREAVLKTYEADFGKEKPVVIGLMKGEF